MDEKQLLMNLARDIVLYLEAHNHWDTQSKINALYKKLEENDTVEFRTYLEEYYRQ